MKTNMIKGVTVQFKSWLLSEVKDKWCELVACWNVMWRQRQCQSRCFQDFLAWNLLTHSNSNLYKQLKCKVNVVALLEFLGTCSWAKSKRDYHSAPDVDGVQYRVRSCISGPSEAGAKSPISTGVSLVRSITDGPLGMSRMFPRGSILLPRSCSVSFTSAFHCIARCRSAAICLLLATTGAAHFSFGRNCLAVLLFFSIPVFSFQVLEHSLCCFCTKLPLVASCQICGTSLRVFWEAAEQRMVYGEWRRRTRSARHSYCSDWRTQLCGRGQACLGS